MIRKLLVANRGEIAVRVIRAAREMGIATVAVASEADRSSYHALLADECVVIGQSEASVSYLDQAKVLEAARTTGADAVHPGYGFLSERSSFARACRDAGLVFVGPSPEAMDRLGAKIDAKRLAEESGVPLVPGFFVHGASNDDLRNAAEGIGYPILLKSSAGGGGRGMRIVRKPSDFDAELATARDEAMKGFGDDEMMVEKLIERPRHIEVQFIADSQGQVACLFERECSVQRRHQKLIEESSSTAMTQPLWDAFRDATVRLVQASGYTNAGTAEFMFDASAEEFYFLEVNARLQVEHPVTEAVTGVDLVQWQLRVASGEVLDLGEALLLGDRSALRGHAIEARIVAEDPARGFLPSTGRVVGWAEPRGPGIRFDTGLREGDEVTRYYDSLIAKLIVHAEDRPSAIRRLRAALADTHILGVQTNIAFLLDISDTAEFERGEVDTGYVDREMGGWSPASGIPEELGALVAAATNSAQPANAGSKVPSNPAWAALDGFRNAPISTQVG
ncbi:MAG: acetyl/propionyl/methylcrotonyl-CoA carboxylase subunit alpha [Fimbriimonadaceae bacterium]